ncbi:tRNA (guanosine(46)-N7)-methyltransferase TrmB [Lujinxingia litoralis]|uniref:tRNA (guanine-N(7)-)-methyltransferase n=1 Tax=Lujinxingia litoralis TaxID=2211119 RepID=A0A328CCE7_9DELT|nr:tRNA (guanosine(46)-N7)-methyltransferase TrmB [Lujinxingia litoralis]RAL23551.1 tRNA (guanosine(46)-N7)-methyltransferase TrmB [Lujinxingia litoralis]
MADLSLRFDEVIEENYDRMLTRIREFAHATPLPERVSLEIGSNRANFLRQLAQRHPDRHYLGIEWRKKYVDFGKVNLLEHGVTNADLLQADATLAIPILFEAGQLSELFILFPDPWWKKRHQKRRIIQPHTLDLFAEKMHSGAHLWLRTDVGTLADDFRVDLDAHPEFELLPFEEMPLEPYPRTTREVKILRKGLPVHTLYYVRR